MPDDPYSIDDVNRILVGISQKRDKETYTELLDEGKKIYNGIFANLTLDPNTTTRAKHSYMVNTYDTFDKIATAATVGDADAECSTPLNIPFAFLALGAYSETPDVAGITARQWSYLMFGLATYVQNKLDAVSYTATYCLNTTISHDGRQSSADVANTEISMLSNVITTLAIRDSDMLMAWVNNADGVIQALPNNLTALKIDASALEGYLLSDPTADAFKKFLKSLPAHIQSIEFAGVGAVPEGVMGAVNAELKKRHNPLSWHEFFQGYEVQVNQDKLWIKAIAFILTPIYAVIEGLVGAIGVACMLFNHGALAGATVGVMGASSISLGALSFWTNLSVGYSYIKSALVTIPSAWESMWYNANTWKKHWLKIVLALPLVACAAGLMGVLHYDTINSSMATFINKFAPHFAVNATVLGHWALAIGIIVVVVELIMFTKSCIDFFRNDGNPLKVIKGSFDQAMSAQKTTRNKVLTGIFMAVIVALSLTGIMFIATGSVGTLKDIFNIKDQAITLAILIPAAIGMAAFFIKNALGLSHTAATALQKLTGDIIKDHFKKNMIFYAILLVFAVVAIVAAATGFSLPTGCFIAILIGSSILNVIWKKLGVKRSFKDVDLRGDVLKYDVVANAAGLGTVVACSAPGNHAMQTLAMLAMADASYANCMPADLRSKNGVQADKSFNDRIKKYQPHAHADPSGEGGVGPEPEAGSEERLRHTLGPEDTGGWSQVSEVTFNLGAA